MAAGAKLIDLYKVDVRSRPQVSDVEFGLADSRDMKELVSKAQEQRRGSIATIRRAVCTAGSEEARPLAVDRVIRSDNRIRRAGPQKSGPVKVKLPLEWWLKTDSLKLLQDRLPFTPDRFLLSLEKTNVSQVGQIKRYMGSGIRNITWCLPPVLFESELAQVQKQLTILILLVNGALAAGLGDNRNGNFQSFLGHLNRTSGNGLIHQPDYIFHP